MIYAGIGSRSTPYTIQMEMYNIARELAIKGWLLRSGGADGADIAFEGGCDANGGKKEIWLPWRRFNGSQSELILPEFGKQFDRAMSIASSVHPAWGRTSQAGRRLHARNVFQVLGADFETPVNQVICWTPNGALVGGTATALRLAARYNIEVVNLGVKEA